MSSRCCEWKKDLSLAVLWCQLLLTKYWQRPYHLLVFLCCFRLFVNSNHKVQCKDLKILALPKTYANRGTLLLLISFLAVQFKGKETSSIWSKKVWIGFLKFLYTGLCRHTHSLYLNIINNFNSASLRTRWLQHKLLWAKALHSSVWSNPPVVVSTQMHSFTISEG